MYFVCFQWRINPGGLIDTCLETKSFKTVQAKFCWNFNNYPQKKQIYRWVNKFQATWSVNNINKKPENP